MKNPMIYHPSEHKMMKKNKKKEKLLKILTPSKLLTRLPAVLRQIKAGKNSKELKNEIRQTIYTLHQYNKITKRLHLIKSL